jgi:acetylornithine deacetylase/succinyl-diaminopimelate desuccinylase-like protein
MPVEAGRIGAIVDELHPLQVSFLAELVKLPSDNPPGDCAPHADHAARLLAELGWIAERHPVPPDLVAANGMISATNLIVRRRFGPGRTIALNAHGDVVPPGAGWSRPPYGAEIDNGVMFGRGVAVSKSDFATYAFALKALEASGLPHAGCVELHLTYDEEAGGAIGPAWLLERGLTRPDQVICAGFAWNVVVAHNGCLHLEVRIEGRSAHAAEPDSGVDALEAATRVLAALYEGRAHYTNIRSSVPGIGHPTLVVGLIEGGINTNVVPDAVTLRLDRRIIPEEDPDEVERELTERIREICATFPGIGVHIRQILLARALRPQPAQDELVTAIRHHARSVLGSDIPATGVPLYTDARHYAAAGIPTVLYGAGPRTIAEANAHRADENLVLEDLRNATKIVALTLADLLAR